MRLLTHLVAALAILPAALAVDQKKSVIVWFDDATTPDSIVNQAKEKVKEAGGQITHVYSIIKGFSATAPEKALEMVQAWGSVYSMKIEEDEMVSAL